ncbi:MAG: 3'-5' exonuclease, partial [Brachymonas sp.]|nr:3'-5' exonuclease [Brachymonas sp.]
AMREQAQQRTLKDIVELVLDASGLIAHYETEREGADRVENLQELVNAAESFVSMEGFGRDSAALAQEYTGVADAGGATGAAASIVQAATESPIESDGETLSPLAAFLTHAALEAGDNQAQAGQDAVQLMTVHAAKGLEFDVVFISGLEEGLFPHENAMNDYDGLEEERRLMYVAITRARKRLYLSYAQTRLLHGQTRYNIRSRFFEELPEECLKWLTPQRSGFADAMPFSDGWKQGAQWNHDVRQSVGQGSRALGDRGQADASTGSSGSSDGLRAGMRVFHNKFGEGTVKVIEGSGADARAQIHFPRHGIKWLALGIAKLTVVD